MHSMLPISLVVPMRCIFRRSGYECLVWYVCHTLQASVQLPAMDADPETIQAAFKGAYGYSDLFWRGVFARLPAAKAAKSEGATDFKAVSEALLAGAQQQGWAVLLVHQCIGASYEQPCGVRQKLLWVCAVHYACDVCP